MTLAAHLLRRALAEDLAARKTAFVSLDKNAQQAAGPAGAPVDPNAPPAGGAPMDPNAPPAPAGGMMGADPAAGAPPAPPMDPSMAPPADPNAAAPPADPMAADPNMGMPPEPMMSEPPPVNDATTDVDDDGKPDTMVPLSGMKDFAVGLIEAMKGKKTQEAAEADAAVGGAASGQPPLPPGPVTGLPGDLSSLPGPLKLGSATGRSIKLKV